MKPGSRVITIYDVACQWSRNFRKRVNESDSLDFPPDMVLVPAVGKWHLGAHIVECFPKYSLNFIKGAGQMDGEILETLWSTTNKVAGTTRAMGKSHRAEVLDDNMYDSNWKKWTGIGDLIFQGNWCNTKPFFTVQSLSQKFSVANLALKSVVVAFDGLTRAVGNPSWLREWGDLEAKAAKDRGEAMMIYNVSPVPGRFFYCPRWPLSC